MSCITAAINSIKTPLLLKKVLIFPKTTMNLTNIIPLTMSKQKEMPGDSHK